jgi:phage regulator Rha-like protein
MSNQFIIPDETVINKIYLFRGTNVMLDSDLADLYGVETRVLNQQIKRNIHRFPNDFMFQLNPQEFDHLKSQILSVNWGGRRKLPFVFTEHGVLMLSSILNSEKAITINIQIVRIFTKMREMILTHKDILRELSQLRNDSKNQEDRIDVIYNYLMEFVNQQKEPEKRNKIGFK